MQGSSESVRVPIVYLGDTVGWVYIFQSQQAPNVLAESFLNAQLKNIVMIALAALVISLLVAVILVGYFLKPLRALNIGASKVEQGNLDHKVPHHSHDELGRLIDSFNRLTSTLRQQKQMREQWLSDISHELRTPLAVLKGEIEAIQDGIRKADTETICSLHSQVESLSQLVNDLHQLSLSDSSSAVYNNKTSFDLTRVMSELNKRYTLRFSEKMITLGTYLENSILMYGDQQAIAQLMTNLFENSYRYTAEGGEVTVSTVVKGSMVMITVEDSAPGVPEDALTRLFERLFRVDKSRSRHHGGSGLGLSICQNIVKAHNGSITAGHANLGGLKVVVLLPIGSENEEAK